MIMCHCAIPKWYRNRDFRRALFILFFIHFMHDSVWSTDPAVIRSSHSSSPSKQRQPLDSNSAFAMSWNEMHNENLLNLTHLWELNVRCCACASFYSHPIEKFVTDKESGGAVAVGAESAHSDRHRTDWIARARIEHITRLVHQTMLLIICHTIQCVCVCVLVARFARSLWIRGTGYFVNIVPLCRACWYRCMLLIQYHRTTCMHATYKFWLNIWCGCWCARCRQKGSFMR